METSDKQKKAFEDQIKHFKELSKIKDSPEFKKYFEAQLETLAQKLIWTFSTGKDGDNVKDWDDFCKVRGEVIARLQPIQDIYAAEGIAQHLKTQLKDMYGVD